jgi:uncharacterized protein (DUF305 family)
MKNNNILYGVIGLLAGIIITSSVGFGMMRHRGMDRWDDDHKKMGMQSAMDSMMMGLSGKTGDAFDKAFLSEMIMHHEGAVEMAESALMNAQHAEIKTLSNAIITAQNKEIADMKAWYKAWYGVDLPDTMHSHGNMHE